MNTITELKFREQSKEERLPDFTADFPYLASRAELDRYEGGFVPWHWHKAVEIFYMESGELEYNTPRGRMVFPAGTGGFVNSNVLHMTRPLSRRGKNIQLLHIFDPLLISGSQGSRIEKKYVIPITAAPQIELFPLSPDIPRQAEILQFITNAFSLGEAVGDEIRIREAMSKIWMKLYQCMEPCLGTEGKFDKNDQRLKTMMVYVQEHYGEKITVSQIAAAVYVSERECFRLFRDYLHMTPTEYIRSCRLKEAARLLADSRGSIADIGQSCGLGDSSYFGKIFRKYAGCSPMEYRRKWQDPTNKCPK